MPVCDEWFFEVLAKRVLILVNCLIAILGLGMLAGGAFLYINYARSFADVISEEGVYIGVGAGAIIFIFSMLGIYGTVTRKKPYLIAYLLVIIAMIVVESIIAVLFLNYMGKISEIPGTDAEDLASTQVEVNNFIYRSYRTCCFDNEEYCSPSEFAANYCAPVDFCVVNENGGTCIVAEPESGFEVDKGVCTYLGSLKYGTDPIVGPNDGRVSCGGGDPEVFKLIIVDWLDENINDLGYIGLGIIILQAIVVIFSGYIICTEDFYDDDSYYDSDEEDYPVVAQAIPYDDDMDSKL